MPMVNCCSQAGDDVDGTSLEPSWSRVGAVDNADGILLEPSWRRCRWFIIGAELRPWRMPMVNYLS